MTLRYDIFHAQACVKAAAKPFSGWQYEITFDENLSNCGWVFFCPGFLLLVDEKKREQFYHPIRK